LVACGGAPQQDANSAADGPKGPPGAVVVADAAEGGEAQAKVAAEGAGHSHDVSPVKEPATIVAHVRWQNPAETVATLAAYAKVPSSMVDSGVRLALKEVVRDGLYGMVDTDAFAQLIATDAPVDALVVVDADGMGLPSEPVAVISVGLRSLQRARAAAKGAGKLESGMWRVGPADSHGPRCVIAAAAGPSQARLVCGEQIEDVMRLAPYMARNLALKPAQDGDLHFELQMRGALDRFGRKLTKAAAALPLEIDSNPSGVPKLDAAALEAANAMVDELGALVKDLDMASLDFDIDERRGRTMRGELKLAGKSSWTAQTMLDGSSLAGPAPEVLWRLPKASTSAGYARTVDPARFSRVIDVGRALVEGGLEKEKIGTALDRRAVAKIISLPFKKHTPAAWASGAYPGGQKPAKGTGFDAAIGDSVGWYMLGYEEPPDAMRRHLKDMVAAYNRPTLRAILKKEAGSDAKQLPIIKTRPAPRKLGRGAFAVEVKLPNVEDPTAAGPMMPPMPPGGGAHGHGTPSRRASKPKTKSITFHLLQMADGPRTFWAIGTRRDELVKLLLAAKGTSPGPDTLAQRRDLDVLRSGKHRGATVSNLNAVLDMAKPAIELATALAPGGAQIGRQANALIGGMPNQGRTVVFGFTDTQNGARPVFTSTMQVPRGTLEDVGWLVQGAIKLFQGMP
jgi:hypothetical protein